MINLFNYSRSIHIIYVFLHSFITLSIHMCALQVFFNSIFKICFFHAKKNSIRHRKPRKSCKHHTLPLVQCTNAYPPPHQNALFFTPLKTNAVEKKLRTPKECICPIRCWLLVRSAFESVFWGFSTQFYSFLLP